MISVFKKKEKSSPIDLYSIASLGGNAENIKRGLGPILGRELDAIVSQFASSKPDLGQYAYLAGQASMIKKLLTSLNMTMEEGREAAEKLRREGIG